MARPLVTSGGTVGTAPLVLVDLFSHEGLTGCSYVFCYTPLVLPAVVSLITRLEPMVAGEAVVPQALYDKLQRCFRLLGPQGLAGIGLAAIDMAAWDLLAKAAGVPLARLLGGEVRPIPAYNSCGLGMIGPERAPAQAEELVAPSFGAIKVRLGYVDVATDVAVVRAVRRAIGEDVFLMSDYNQSLSVPEALHRMRALDEEGLYWVEEPTRADDYMGHAQIRREARTPIQIGENWWGPHDMAKSLQAGASDYVMADAMKIWGVTGWLRAAALAEAAGLPLSCHLFPEISAHLLAVSPTRHWLEYVDWANPILAEPLEVENGHALAIQRPGSGIEWNEDRVKVYLLT